MYPHEKTAAVRPTNVTSKRSSELKESQESQSSMPTTSAPVDAFSAVSTDRMKVATAPRIVVKAAKLRLFVGISETPAARKGIIRI